MTEERTDKSEYNIVHLPKEQWEGEILPMGYTTQSYFDVDLSENDCGYHIKISKRTVDKSITHTPEEYDFPDRLYQPHWEKAFAWGIVDDVGEKPRLLAAIETCPEEWSNRLVVTELWVHEDLRRRGIGHRLMAVAKEQARLEHRRAVILETQSCNTAAIAFYQSEGFKLIGLDTCCYSNQDVERREVRFNMGCFLRKDRKVAEKDIVIRPERPKEYKRVEQMVLDAFWNKYRQGCNEHFLVHQLREQDIYLPDLSRIAVIGDEIVGAIFYSKSLLENDHGRKEILTFGPLCVAPEWQGCGVGERLLKETLELAGNAGYEGVVIMGEPDYYPRLGFKTCDHFGITTADGKNFDAFMGIELVPGGLSAFGGRYIEAEFFESLSEEENQVFTKGFETPGMQKFPGQWNDK